MNNRIKTHKFIKQKEWFSIDQCNTNPNNLYIFGDNVMRVGCGGQAIIRNCQNSYGIATKWAPGRSPKDYFSDTEECQTIIDSDLEQLILLLENTNWIKQVIFPADGLGTGLSNMQTKAPKLLKYMNNRIFNLFGIDY